MSRTGRRAFTEDFGLDHASGPTETLAVIGAEQRYLVEEVGDRPAAPGKTYLDKAEERLRRGRRDAAPPG